MRELFSMSMMVITTLTGPFVKNISSSSERVNLLMYKPGLAMWSKNTNLILQELSDQERTRDNQNIGRDRQEETDLG